MRFIPKRVFFEARALEYPFGEKIYSNIKKMGVDIQLTPSHNRVTGIPGRSPQQAYREAKRTLVVGVRKMGEFATCKPSAHYQLPLATSCPGMCEYCYLATNLGKKPYLRIYANIEEILEKAQEYIEQGKPEITVFEGAATSDPIPVEYLSGLLAHTIEFFANQPKGRFRFVTKHTDIDSLLHLNHGGHTHFRFSINAETVITRYEHNTPDLKERVEAAQKINKAGYPLGFIIAPVFYFPGWKKEYGELLELLKKELQGTQRDSLSFEVITHRFTTRAKNTITSLFPNTTLPMGEKERKFKYGQFGYGKYIYSKEIMEEMKGWFYENIEYYFPGSQVKYFV